MFKQIANILTLKPFKVRNDDPFLHYTKKVGNKPFMLVVLGHQQIKYAKAQFVRGRLNLGRAFTAYIEQFQNSELDTAWVVEFLQEAGETKNIVLGLNLVFSNFKIYPAGSKFKDIEDTFVKNPAEEVGQTFDNLTRYFFSQVGDQVCLNGVEADRIAKARDKFKKFGCKIVCTFHYPSAVLSKISDFQMKWNEPGVLVYYTQKLLFFMGWISGDIVTVRSRLIAEQQRGATGTRPMLNTLQREIDITSNLVVSKANGQPVNLYIYNDKQDATLTGLEAMYKNAQIITWPQDVFDTETRPYTEPDLAVVLEREAIV